MLRLVFWRQYFCSWSFMNLLMILQWAKKCATHPSGDRNVASERFLHFRSEFEGDKMLFRDQARVGNRTRNCRHGSTFPRNNKTRFRFCEFRDFKLGAVCDRSVMRLGHRMLRGPFDPRVRCCTSPPLTRRSPRAERVSYFPEKLPIWKKIKLVLTKEFLFENIPS